ncbi:uncharacterized protein BP5553_05712 [Venustampulla echinocandica]|uniref:Acyltransferase 3 domain-containing protein n=1 Tax=Venustampulla echinocandica TaxID=2656787 RepID=A0A370TLF6_9HELO|nr:uncharacterized protein BP5553_05712 [Venustampulla echinocandica]RDL36360.1 hypothetical protein BP5553_05712 [Venustampulla echinocandica]
MRYPGESPEDDESAVSRHASLGLLAGLPDIESGGTVALNRANERVGSCFGHPQKPSRACGRVRGTISAIAIATVPSFVRLGVKRKLYPTSYLDGLRGVAAFIVFIDHFTTNWFDPLRRGYGSTDEDHHLAQLPFIRLLFAGRASVAVFFVISGFVLSYRPIKEIRMEKFESLLDTLASSVFRRGLRLYLPVAAGTFISMLAAYWGWYRALPESSTDSLPPDLPTFSEHFWYWRDHTVGVSWPLQDVMPNSPYAPPYNGHLWTIPIEFYGSMVVYVTVLGLSRCQAWIRLLLIGLGALLTLQYERWDICLFLSGILLAETSLISVSSDDFALEYSEKRTGIFGILGSASLACCRFLPTLNYLLLIFSLYLLSYPGEPWPEYETPPGPFHHYLVSWTPPRYIELWFGIERFWTTIGGVIVVFTISKSTNLQRPFTTRLAQYLGDISYALYIVHGPILFTAGTWFMDTYGQATDSWHWGAAFIAGGIMNTVLCVWAADIFWRAVDAKSVGLAKWFAGKCWRTC